MTSSKISSMTQKVDWLNLCLVIISLLCAILFPFSLFLIVYAILGPLHYLTQINWIQSHHFFMPIKSWPWLAVIVTLVVTIPFIYSRLFASTRFDIIPLKQALYGIQSYSNLGILALLFLPLTLYLAKNRIHQTLTFISLMGAGFLIYQFPMFTLIIGLLLSSVIHVYLFTFLFVVQGAWKNKSRPALLTASVMLAAIPIVVFLPVSAESYFIPDVFKNIYAQNKLYAINLGVSQLFGWSDGQSFSYESMELRIQMFLSFAYCYHYLNWFSKTSVIGWSKNLNKPRTFIIGTLWVICVTIYAFDYRLGFIGTLVLSFLHVALEFPLNIRSMRYLYTNLYKTLLKQS